MNTPPTALWVGIVADTHVTSDIEAEARRRQLCHDLRQNLGAIHSLVDGVAASPGLPAAAREGLADVVAELDTASRLLRAELEPAGEARVVVDLVELVRDAARSHQRLHGVDVRLTVAEQVRVVATPGHLRRAVCNLLDNACRACPTGTVEVRVRRRPAWAVVDVLDRGPGLGHISTGTGHGLAQVQATVAAHGGRARVANRPGGGTRARLSLPRLATFAS